jgi:tetratricopeptide (TPR) repeat protein
VPADGASSLGHSKPPSQEARYALLLTRGILHFHQGELGQAGADFQKAVNLKPDQYNGYLNLAHVHLARGELDYAEQRMKEALRRGPPEEVVLAYLIDRGRSLVRAGRYDEALGACDAAMKLRAQQPNVWMLRGRVLLALERYRSAEETFDSFLHNGGNPGADFYRGRGLARMKLAKYPEAIDDYSRALELVRQQSTEDRGQRTEDRRKWTDKATLPSDFCPQPSELAELYQHRGWAHFFADAWKLAARDFAQAIELDPTVGDTYIGLGLARVMLGDYRAALCDAEKAQEWKPRTPEMLHNLACLYAQAAGRAQADAAAPGLANDCRKRALEKVQETLAALRPEDRPRFWRGKIAADSALSPIWNHPGWSELKQEYAERE